MKKLIFGTLGILLLSNAAFANNICSGLLSQLPSVEKEIKNQWKLTSRNYVKFDNFLYNEQFDEAYELILNTIIEGEELLEEAILVSSIEPENCSSKNTKKVNKYKSRVEFQINSLDEHLFHARQMLRGFNN